MRLAVREGLVGERQVVNRGAPESLMGVDVMTSEGSNQREAALLECIVAGTNSKKYKHRTYLCVQCKYTMVNVF